MLPLSESSLGGLLEKIVPETTKRMIDVRAIAGLHSGYTSVGNMR
jgi:hypothetical protein